MNTFINAFNFISKLLTPPRAFSWQTLILLSTFSCVMSYLATDYTQNILAFFGWIFLIFGVSWATTEYPLKIWGFSLGPWITGALVCIFIFGSWRNEVPASAWIWWPPISAILASIKDFFDEEINFRLPLPSGRQRIVILLTSNLIISCWFQFYFVVQNWLNQYPTLLADDFQKSAFVVKIESPVEIIPRGGLFLNLLETPLKQEINNQPWSKVERWLLNSKSNLVGMANQIKKEVDPIQEDIWWQFKPEIKSIGSGYKLKVQAIWDGPRSQPGQYYIEKSCNINQVDRKVENRSATATNSSEVTPLTIAVGEVKCEALGRLWFEKPASVQQ